MTDRIAEIRARIASATNDDVDRTVSDAALIACAPSDLAWLCDEVERLRLLLSEDASDAVHALDLATAFDAMRACRAIRDRAGGKEARK